MKKILDRYHTFLTWLMVAATGVLLIPVSLQIFSRFTQLIPAYLWTEEASRFLFIWLIMLGAMIGVREGTHFEVDLWPELGARGNALLKIVSNLFVLVFALVYSWWGVGFTQFGWNQTSEIADLPMWLIFIAWPVSGLTWMVFLGESFYDNAQVLMRRVPQ